MSDFYKDSNCLVIGGAGFVGLHLVRFLLEAGANVTVLDNLSRPGYLPEKELVGAKFAYGDCSHEGTCKNTFKNQQYIFNLAAWVAGVEYNQRNQARMYERNWLTQHMPLRVAYEYGAERFLSVSSVCVYAPGYNAPCEEPCGFIGEPVAANLGYSLSKRAGERMAIWYAEMGLHTVRVRPSNLYGPGDYFDERAHVIPALIRKTFENDTIVVNGSGKERREFLYVEDAARGMMAALEYSQGGDVYNLGTNGETSLSIECVARTIRNGVFADKPIVFKHQFDSGDDERWSDAGQAWLRLGWRYRTGIEEGIEKTVEWYANTQANQTAN